MLKFVLFEVGMYLSYFSMHFFPNKFFLFPCENKCTVYLNFNFNVNSTHILTTKYEIVYNHQIKFEITSHGSAVAYFSMVPKQLLLLFINLET